MIRNLAPMWTVGEGRHACGDHTYQMVCVSPCYLGWSNWNCDGVWNRGGITVDGEPVYPAIPHPTCVTAGTCQGSCYGRGH